MKIFKSENENHYFGMHIKLINKKKITLSPFPASINKFCFSLNIVFTCASLLVNYSVGPQTNVQSSRKELERGKAIMRIYGNPMLLYLQIKKTLLGKTCESQFNF